MADYQKMYVTLFSAITESIHLLQVAQQLAEQIYLETGEPPLLELLEALPRGEAPPSPQDEETAPTE